MNCEQATASYTGFRITRVDFDGNTDALNLYLSNGRLLSIEDTGQSCCERRFVTCDDSFESFRGAKLVSIEERDGGVPTSSDDETQFVVVTTDKGAITLTTHNENNGYYGGFTVEVTERPA